MSSQRGHLATTQMLALYRFGAVTPRLFEALLRHFGTLQEIIDASADDLEGVEGVTSEVAEEVASAKHHMYDAESLIREFADRDITMTGRHVADYPHLLLELNDPPPLLFVRGRMPSENKKTIALIGPETATAEGIEFTTQLAKRFAGESVQIISSLTGGNDVAAHLGSRAAGLGSYAVLDRGFDCLEQQEIMPLAIDIAQGGGVISEYLPDQEPNQVTMIESNRLIVGLAQAVVVAECHASSARTLDLMAFCQQIGKLMFIVADPERDPLIDGESLRLAVANGAILMEGFDKVDDIVKVLV